MPCFYMYVMYPNMGPPLGLTTSTLLTEYLPAPKLPSFLLLGGQRTILYFLLSLVDKHSQNLLGPQFTEAALWLWKRQCQLNLKMGVKETYKFSQTSHNPIKTSHMKPKTMIHRRLHLVSLTISISHVIQL